MAERPEANADRLRRAAQASNQAAWERIAPISLNVTSQATQRRYNPDGTPLVGRPVAFPNYDTSALPGPRTPVEAYYRQFGSGMGTVPMSPSRVNPVTDWQRSFGAGSSATPLDHAQYFESLRERIQRGEILIDENGGLVTVPDLLTPEERERLGSPSDAAAAQTDGMYPVPGLGAGEFRSADQTEEDQASAALARQDPFRSTSIARSYERARVEAAIRRMNLGFQPSRTVFNGDWDDEDTRVRWLYENYPTVALAAAEEGLSERDVAAITNLAMARDTAVEIVNEPIVPRRRQMIAALPPTQAALVESIIADMQEEERQNLARRPAQDGQQGFVQTAMSAFWGSVGPGTGVDEETGEVTNRALSPAWILDVLYDVAEFGQHVGRAVALDYAETDWLGKTALAIRSASTLGGYSYEAAVRNWEATEPGSWNEEGLAEARARYGDEEVDLIVEMLNARNDGSTQSFWNALDLVVDDPRKMQIFMTALRDVDTDDNIREMVEFVSAQTNSNFGDIFARGTGFEPGSLPFDVTSDTANVVGFFVLDPLIAAGVAGKAVNGARYGLYALTKADEGAEAGQFLARSIKGSGSKSLKGRAQDWWYGTANVRRYLDWYGGEIERIRGLKGVERGNAQTTLLSQSKRYFDADVFEGAMRAGVKDADTFYDWIQGADDFIRIMRGQGAKRGKDMMIPHMSRATRVGKAVSLRVRGLDPTRWVTERAEREMALVLGDDFVELSAEAQRERLLGVLQSEEETIRVATALSDLRGTRSRLGRAVNKIGKQTSFADNQQISWKRKYGWQRERAESVTDFLIRWADRFSRGFTRFPTKSTLRLDSARDANTVYEMMRGAGLPRYWASTMRAAWTEMSPGQRRLAAAGLARTYGYASGLHLVDPDAMKYLDEIMTGLKSTDSYGVPLSEELIQAGVRGSLVELDPSVPPKVVDPSMVNGVSSGIWMGQMADQVALPNFGAIDALRARTSWMGAILMQNRLGTGLTDWWVLATLAGPRFAVRNGIEDAALYALTSGSGLGWWRGRQVSTALREATPRSNKWVASREFEVSRASEELAKARRLGDPDRILQAEEVLEKARVGLTEAQLELAGRGQKLGSIKTITRYAGDKLPFLRYVLLPHLSRSEVNRAARAAAKGDREELNKLVAQAFLRQKVAFFKSEEGIALTRALRDDVEIEDLPENLQVILRDIDDFVNSPLGIETMKEASEETRHLLDASLTRYPDQASVKVVNGQVMLRKTEGVTYEGSRVVEAGTPQQVRGVLAALNFALHTDGPKAQRAMALLPDYFNAVALGRTAERERIVRELAAFIDNSSDEAFDYVGRFSLASAPDSEQLARRTLDNLTGMFTTQQGRFHDDLYNKLKMPEEYPGVQRFKLYYTDANGNRVDNVTDFDFAQGMIEMPAYTNVRHSEGVWVPEGNLMLIPEKAWEMMGRSLARMTREPIFLSNYLEARTALRPLENRLINLGEDPAAARKRISNLAVDRAYEITMSYVDNPMIRSRIAWSVRNIARFYRAQEDFVRRMWRMGENYPMGFYKAAVGWEALQEIGFIHEDQYGEQYFVYPGSGAALDAVNRLSGFLGFDSPQQSLPLNLTGKLQWVTPSADPDSWNPSLSSFWSGFAIKGALRALPMLNSGLKDLARATERELFGDIGLDQGWANSWVPPNVTRILAAYSAFTAADPSGADVAAKSLAASAIRRSMLAMASAGLIPSDGVANPDEIRKLRSIADTQAMNALVVLLVSGATLPASPQLQVGDVSTFARELGVQGLRPAFLEMVRKFGFDEGYLRWVQTNPELAIFSESESSSGSIGRYEATTETVEFVKENLDIMEESPNGLSYFAPINGEDTLAAYNYLNAMGLSAKMDPADYLLTLMKSQGAAQQFILRQWRDTRIERATSKEDITAINKVYSANNRLLDDFYGTSSEGEEAWSKPGDFRREWESIRNAATALAERGDELAQRVVEVDVFYQARLNAIAEANSLISGERKEVVDDLKEGWRLWLDAVLAENTDERFERILRIATGGLFGSQGNWPWSPGYGVEEE